MRIFYLLFFLLVCLQSGSSQFYQIYGPQTVSGCSFEQNIYNIETSEQLISTTWTVVPSSDADVIGNVYFAEVIFHQPGFYFLQSVSISVNGEVLSDSLAIFVEDLGVPPVVEGCYVIDGRTGCYQVCAFSQSIIEFPQGTNDQWQVTGAESYTFNGTSLEIMWGSGGNGTVNVFSLGCTYQLCFNIFPEPIADFITSPGTNTDTLTVCKGQEIFFENQSSNAIEYHWNFGDGATSTDYHVSHTYADEGFYTATLYVETICDCSSEKEIVINVLPAPAPTLDCVNSVCPGMRQRYTATTTGCTTYNWSVSPNGTVINGGETTDDFIEVIWHEGPDGFIDLSVSGCMTAFCSFTNRFRVPIITPNGPISGDISICTGEIATYTAPYFPGTEYQWQVGPAGTILGEQNKSAVTIKWNNVDVVTPSFVEVQYDNCFLECGGSDVLAVNITPEITLSGDMQVCQNGMASVHAMAGFLSTAPAAVNWHIEDKSGNIIASSPGAVADWSFVFAVPAGNYLWVATNSSAAYCTEIAKLDIQVTQTPGIPLGIEGETDICPGQPYGYTIINAGNYATLWTITDGASTYNYSGNTCSHTFGNSPPYLVEAWHTDIQFLACASPTLSLVVNSADNLFIDGPSEACLNGIYNYETDYVSGTTYEWEIIPSDYGEIRRSNLNTVDVFWTQTGLATLRLRACGYVIDYAVLVHDLPVFNIVGPLAACPNVPVNVTTDQPASGHVWLNANGMVLSMLNNVDLSPGAYAVELTDQNGCMDKKSVIINSYPKPVVHISSPYDKYYCNMVPGGIQITANTDGPNYLYTWYKDNVPVAGSGPIYNVTDFGSYYVAVTNQYGCTTFSLSIEYLDCCAPNTCGAPGGGSFPGNCVFLASDFMLEKTKLNCNRHVFEPMLAAITPGTTRWIIKSASKGVIDVIDADILDYTYSDPGYYQLEVISTLTGFPYGVDQCGHHENIIDTVYAVADFKHEGICVASPISFEDLTTYLPGQLISSWAWSFDDPFSGSDNTSSMQDPMHTFGAAGIYNVTLTVTTSNGCTTLKEVAVNITDGPDLMPSYEIAFCEDEAMAFQLPGNLFDIKWNFGDVASGLENTAVTDSVFHTYQDAGFYPVTVAAFDINQCQSDENFMVEIKQNTSSGLIDVLPLTPLCSGDTATLTSPPGGISWEWSNGETTAQIEVAETNQYNVLIRDTYHCTYSPPAVFVEVYPKPVVDIRARIIYGPNMYGPWDSTLVVCLGTEFEIQAFSSNGVSYHWSHGPTDPLLQFTTEGANLPGPGLHEYEINTIDLISGCISDSSLILIEVVDLPNVPVIALISGSSCSFDDNILQVSNPQAGITYLWSDGQSGQTITAKEAGPYYVEAINDLGCSAQSNTIIIRPSALVDQIPGGCFIACDPLTVCLPTLSQVLTYTIYQNGVVYQTGTTWPSDYLITADGTYTIEVSTTNGCIATSDPLDVMLYTGVGSITVETWEDLDGDGVISAGDMLLPGIPVQILSDDGLHTGMTETVPGGQFVFTDYPAEGYLATIDLNLLSPQWIVLIDSVQTQITTCGDSVIVSLLLTQNCTVTGPDQWFDLCPGESVVLGDSTWMNTGTYTMHMQSMSGCDSVFQVVITAPDSLDIIGHVWVDVDHNGILSPADTLISGISVSLTDVATNTPSILVTDGNGAAHWYESLQEYLIAIDTSLLPANYTPILFESMINDTSCGTVVVDFLIESACPPVFVITQATLCPGDSILIDGQWVTDAGLYSYIQSDSVTLCDTVYDVHVTLSSEIMIQSTIDWNCQTLGSIALSVTGDGPFDYQWNPPFTGDTLTGLVEGDYTVYVTDVNGCSTQETYTIVSSAALYFEVPDYYVIEQGDSVYIEIVGDINEPGLTFEWIPSDVLGCSTCPSTWAYPMEDITLIIQITDADSCVYLLQTYIAITADTAMLDEIYIPNVFSPNGDGINDLWTIFSRNQNTYINDLAIYDRWGTMVFYNKAFMLNTFSGWDGTFKGKPLNPGVFVYTGVVKLADGTEQNVKGDVTLLR